MIPQKNREIAGNPPRFGEVIFRTLIAARNATFPGPHLPDGPFCSEIWSVLTRDYLPKGAIFGDRWITRDFRNISENRGRTSTVWRFAVPNSNRGSEFPIFGIILVLPRGPDLAHKAGPPANFTTVARRMGAVGCVSYTLKF